MSGDDNQERIADSDDASSGASGDQSPFAELLDQVEEQRARMQERAREKAADVVASATQDEGTIDDGPFDRIRKQTPSEFIPSRDTGFRNRRKVASGHGKLYLGIVLGLLLALFVPGVAAMTVGHVDDTFFAPPPAEYIGPDDTLYLEAEDAAYLTRIFQETSHEVAYCGLITRNEGQPRLEIWMANTVNAGPEQVEFITDNCPEETREVLLHTHPNGVLRASEQDRRTLEERPEKFLCVQGGPLETEPGTEAENLACYRQLESGDDGLELASIRVFILESSIGSP